MRVACLLDWYLNSGSQYTVSLVSVMGVVLGGAGVVGRSR